MKGKTPIFASRMMMKDDDDDEDEDWQVGLKNSE